MMTKECICKDGKTDPKCPACNKKVDYLKDFHRINPEANPRKKMAGLFSAPAKGFFGGMDPTMKAQLLQGAQGAAPMLAAGIPAAALAATAADKGEGSGDALRAGLLAGGTAAAAHFGHNMMMGGSSPLAHSYQRGIGTDIRNLANKGREAMKMPTVAPPRPPKVASVDQFKLAFGGPAVDPYQDYGQYGGPEQHQDNGPGLGTALAIGGMGVLGHAGLMASRGQFARGYQANLGNAIRAATNRARTGIGMSAVPLPPHGIVGKVQDMAHNVAQAVGPAAEIGGKAYAGAKVVQGAHNDMMGRTDPIGNAYKKYVVTPAGNAASSVENRVREWMKRPAASAKVTSPPPQAAAKKEAPKAAPKEAPASSAEDTKIGPGVTKRPAKKEASLADLLLSTR